MHPQRRSHLAFDGGHQEMACHSDGHQCDVHEEPCTHAEHVDAEIYLAHQALRLSRQAGTGHRNHHETHRRDEMRGRDHLKLQAIKRKKPKENQVACGKGADGAGPPQQSDPIGINATHAPLTCHNQ